MRRSSTSCLKIITCGSGSVDRDDFQVSEGKGSSDKRGWSFRKRSARHRVLSNTVISETPSSGNKENPESTIVNFQTQDNSTIPDKTPATQWMEEKPQLSATLDSKVSETIATTEDGNKVDVIPDESDIIVIQAAIRGFLAQRALLKHKKIVKLQAAVRGHLVRRHAVGTLRCVQAIVKMQALVRARRARLLGKENFGTKPQLTYTSTEKLLSNRFALQLLESTPRTKTINIKCDPSKSDSAWKWLERWVSVSSTRNDQLQRVELITEQQQQEKVEHSDGQVETVTPSEECRQPTDIKPCIGEAVVPFESEENLITYNADSFDFQACRPTSSPVSHNLEQPQPESTGTPNSKKNSFDSLRNQTRESDLISPAELDTLSGKPETETEKHKHSLKRSAPEQPETEGKKLVFGSRKASNPAFIAAHSKFEELSSAASSLSQDLKVETNSETVSSSIDNTIRTRDIGLAEKSVSNTSKFQAGGSECGTELSISSTLDSPDRSEVGAMEFEQEAKISEEVSGDLMSVKNVDYEAKGETTIPGTDLSFSVSVHPEKFDDVSSANGEPINSGIDSSQIKQKPEKNTPNVQIERESETGHQAYKSSPEASPGSHVTVPPESQGTPSSQLSVKAKKTRSEKGGSKHRSLSAVKRSPSNPNHDSGSRSSLEQLTKDHKTGKRRNSFGSARPDHVDQEPRDSSSSNSLPNYMQATESAKAKALANSSPRSSPDVQDKEVYIKKRHSLPGANGRQGSPHIQRSLSHAQQSAKGNGTHPHERKWQR